MAVLHALVGASFRNHPAGTPTADGAVEDTDDHSTQGLPAPTGTAWTSGTTTNRPTTPPVGGGGTDYTPRPNVHVLISLDESTYDEDDGNTTDDDHPISWCHRYEGGRSWYTGMGHTDQSFTEANYLKHILGGIEVSAEWSRPRSAASTARRAGGPGLRRSDDGHGAAQRAVLVDGGGSGRPAR